MSQLLQYYKSFQQSRNPLPNLTPTFEDLSIDDNLSELQRLVKYARSSIGLQRLVHVKMLANIASSVGYKDTKAKIVPLLEGISHDTEPAVKQHFVEQLSPLAEFCRAEGEEDGYQTIITKILPITARLLEDEKPEVRQAACTTLVNLAAMIRIDDIGQHVLTIILRLAHEDDKEEMRMTAAELLNSLAGCLGQDLCKQFVIPEVVSLAEDPGFRVRKATALNFHFVCKVGGEHELFERLMPAFVRLSKDDMYRVRRACAESLSEISKYVSDDIRIGVLVEIFLRLAQDPSRVVKQSVLQQSGMFISTMLGRAVNSNILAQFCSMAASPTGDANVDAELKHYCAYSFPAVLQTVGPGRWKELRGLYQSLVHCRSASVKQTLAASLHEVARILGEGSLVEEELLPVFEEMIQDGEAVQMGVIKYIAKFLGMLSGPCRVSFLPLLHDILHSTNPFNWRLRQSLAVQLPDLIDLPNRENLYTSLFPLIMTLLQDPVAGVRKDTYKGVSKLINVIYSEATSLNLDTNSTIYQEQLEAIIKAVNTLAQSEIFQVRQVWVELCWRLLRELPQELFEMNFIEGILLLTSDPVCNVRVTVAMLLAGWAPEDAEPWAARQLSSSANFVEGGNESTAHFDEDPKPSPSRPSPWSYLFERHDIGQCVLRLQRDDRDVGLKAAPGGAVPVQLEKYSTSHSTSDSTVPDNVHDQSENIISLKTGISIDDSSNAALSIADDISDVRSDEKADDDSDSS